MSDELKPCPFCGGPAQVINAGPGNCYVRCSMCGAASDDRARSEAIAAWNRRVPADALEAAATEAERLRAMLADIHRVLCETRTLPAHMVGREIEWCIDHCRIGLKEDE
jgi:Lar family restriction alleviation protein